MVDADVLVGMWGDSPSNVVSAVAVIDAMIMQASCVERQGYLRPRAASPTCAYR